MNRYRAVHPSYVAIHGTEPFDHEFDTPTEEADALRVLEIVPRRYRVIGPNAVDGHSPGDEFDAALTMGREAQLTAGGHIERVESASVPKAKKAPAKRAAHTKE